MSASYRGGHVIFDHDRMTFEQYHHIRIFSPGWTASNVKNFYLRPSGSFTYTADQLHIIFDDRDTGFITPGHWVHPVNIVDSHYVPPKLKQSVSVSNSSFSVSGYYIFEKQE